MTLNTRVVGQEEQGALGHRFQDAHPRLEDLRGDFVIVVKGAIEHACRLDPELCFAEPFVRHLSLGVIDLVAREVGDFLGVVRLLGLRNDGLVGQEIVHVGGTDGAQIPQITQLNRRGSVGKKSRAAAVGVTTQVHRNINTETSRQGSSLLVREVSDVLNMVKGFHHPLAHLVAGVLGVQGGIKGVDLKVSAIVQLKELGHQDAHRMVLEVGGDVSDFDFSRGRGAGTRAQGLARCDQAQAVLGRHGVLDIELGRFQLQCWCVDQGQQLGRLGGFATRLDALAQLFDIGLEMGPIAAEHFVVESETEQKLIVRIQGLGFVVIEHRRFKVLHQVQQLRLQDVDFGDLGCIAFGQFKRLQGLIKAKLLFEQFALVGVRKA